MAIDIQYKDFDTVAYSYRHNIEQLIKASVGLSVEVNITINRVDGMQTDLSNLQALTEGQQDQIVNLDTYTKLIADTLMENLKSQMKINSDVASILDNLNLRVTALENG